MDTLSVVLRRIRRRMAFQQWLAFNVEALMMSLTLCVAICMLTRLFPSVLDPTYIYVACVALGVLAATGWAVYRRPKLLDAALEADKRLGLQERLSSSLSLEGVEGPMVEAVHADARGRLAQVDAAKAFPYYPPRAARWLAVPVLAFAAASFVPELDLFGLQQKQVEAKAKLETRRVQAERIKELAKPIREAASTYGAGDMADMPKALEQLADQLQSGEITEKQALAKVSSLSEDLQKRQENLKQNMPTPQLLDNLAEYGAARDAAKSIQKGEFGQAAKEMQKLAEKMKKGELSPEEKKKLSEGMKKLADSLKSGKMGANPELAKALEKAAESMEGASGDMAGMEEALNDLENVELSMKDLASAMEQLQKLNVAQAQMMKWKQGQLGPSKFCRNCGKALKPCKEGKNCKGCKDGQCSGVCGSCAGEGMGAGMGGAGIGQGNTTGPLGDVNDAFEPTMLPGQMTQGKALLDIVQRTAPNPEDAQSTAEFIEGVVVDAQQEAEQALTKEEIPTGSKEFVRQYFGSLEPEKAEAQ
ncbi:MAG: hypothetical protein RBU21_08495 [FCB group bacterium]|jgi:chemotaxis protein histidine kinase CheA|nr:hypothetical protein [FCB group bacterium]